MNGSTSDRKTGHPREVHWAKRQLMERAKVALCLELSFVARPVHSAAAPASTDPPLVGALGRPEALVFEGNSAFTKERILEGMAFHLDYYIAAHRAAPFDEFSLEDLRNQVLQALELVNYFQPRVRVRVVPDPARKLADLLVEIAAATADHQNDYLTNHGFSSWVSFMATDLIEAPFVETLLQAWIDESAEAAQPTNTVVWLRKARSATALARELIGQEATARLLEPLSRLFPSRSDDEEDQESFDVPQDVILRGVDPTIQAAAAILLARSDAIFPSDSWMWVLLREAAFTLAGQGRYNDVELDRVRESDDLGPVGCLATAWLVARGSPRVARTFAERGLSRLTAEEFHKDYRVWLNTNSIVGEVSANVLGFFRSLREDQLAALTTDLTPADAAFVRSLGRMIRDAQDRFRQPTQPGPRWNSTGTRSCGDTRKPALTIFCPKCSS